ncbi:tetratricopeptide repeat protein [uncultured Marinobacter sp.]|uniref:YfgM family protein n=1 Tax=uncultured Marinobacter sp. TaxID=187379 RepID=UPI0030D95886
MAELRTEEEQVEAIKNWFRQNGTSLLIGIGAALAIVFGWQAWQTHQANEQASAANAFNRLLEASSQQSSDENRETVRYLGEQLRSDYPDTPYATYASLLLASEQLMEENDPAAARESLSWALDRVESGSTLELLVRSRLARAQLAEGDLDAALATLRSASDTGAFTGLMAELEGDILMASGDQGGARKAYLRAREAAGSEGLGLLQLKLADLGIGGDA